MCNGTSFTVRKISALSGAQTPAARLVGQRSTRRITMAPYLVLQAIQMLPWIRMARVIYIGVGRGGGGGGQGASPPPPANDLRGGGNIPFGPQ